MRLLLLLLAIGFITPACKRDEEFPDLGLNVASPVDVAKSEDGSHFFILNADFDRTYNKGSILVIDEEGNKVAAVETPRMGRAMVAAGKYLLASFGRQDDKNRPVVALYDITNPKSPSLIQTWENLRCNVVNFALVADYNYFAAVCSSGSTFIGTLPEGGGPSLKKVRNHAVIRRALYIDPNRNLLLAFPTKFDKPTTADGLYDDAYTYNPDTDEKTEGANDIPDVFEDSKAQRNNKRQRRRFQFFIYDIAAESNLEKTLASGCKIKDDEDCIFPNRKSSDPVAQTEERFIYFKVANFDGTPDLANDNPDQKYYRTNFYEAAADPDDPNAFYISHRGVPTSKGSPYANDVIKVSFIGNYAASEDGVVPATADYLDFERVFGFKGTAKATKFPGDMDIVNIGGQKIVLVNNFRDLVNWKRDDVYFSIEAQSLDSSLWVAETTDNTDPETSWYQIAANERGKAVSVSFYGSAAMLLNIEPNVGISTLKRIE